MLREIILLLSAVAACLTAIEGRGWSTKNVHKKQTQPQFASVASYHASKAMHEAPSPYSFGYEADAPEGGGSARQESADASGKVTGSYTVTNEDGSVRVVKYVADEQGFRADVDTNEPGTKSENPADVAFKSAAVVDMSAPMTTSRFSSQRKTYSGQFEQKKQVHQFRDSTVDESPKPYSYSYEARMDDGESARSETGDTSGKVTGHYSMSIADGRQRMVDYSADGMGFKAKINTNEFGTKSESPADVEMISSAPMGDGPATKSFSRATMAYQPQKQMKKFSQTVTRQEQVQQPIQFADVKPSPYSFNYEAQMDDGSSSRTESADGSGRVVGSYKLSGADGRQRVLDYEADQGGFRASIKTNEFGTKSDSPADVKMHSSAPDAAPMMTPMRPISSSGRQIFQRTKTGPSMMDSSRSSFRGQSSIQYGSQEMSKPSPFAFDYVAQLEDGSSSRSESGDESGKVVGSYGLRVADGRQRTVDYYADKEGFRATVNTNEFGTKADSPADIQMYSTATFDEPAPYSSPSSRRTSSGSMTKTAQRTEQRQVQYSSAKSPSHYGSTSSQDAGYSFSYQSDMDDGMSARSESSDGSGEVKGQYSMSVADGRRRQVDYSAGGQGFKATVDTNEFGTKSESPADVTFISSAPQDIMRLSGVSSKSTFMPQAPQMRHGSGAPSTMSQQQFQVIQQEYAPYSFGYEAEATGGSSARKEEADSSGKVTGSYTVVNEDGSVRVVEYIADKDGFRAKVNTNEPGTKSEEPANVSLKSDALAPIHQRAMKDNFPARTYTPKSSMVSQKHIDAWGR